MEHHHDHNHNHKDGNSTMHAMHKMQHQVHQVRNLNPGGVKIPVTVVGGFLGSGKTTLVNYILSHSAEKKMEVMVREYGTVAIDDKLINLKKEQIHVFPGLSMHHDPQTLLYSFMEDTFERSQGKDFEHFLIETSGLDSPENLVQLFFLGHMPSLYRLANFVTVVDAEYGHLNLNEYKVAKQQVAYADVILLNKIDLPDEETIQSLERRIRNMNAMAKIIHTTYGRAELSEVLELSLYDQLNSLNQKMPKGGKDDYMDDGITTLVLTETCPMDKEKINAWIQNLFDTRGTKILRSKGFFCFAGSDYRYEFQAVRKTYHSKADKLWQENEEKKSVVVLIGEGLADAAELQESFSACKAN